MLWTQDYKSLLYWNRFVVLFSLYLSSNIILGFVPFNLFTGKFFIYFILLFDVIMISLGMYFAQGFNSDIYLVYFLVIFMATLRQEIKGSIIIGIVSGLIYLGLLLRTQGKINVFTTEILLRIPFLLLISMMGSYIAEESRLQKEKTFAQIRQKEKVLYLGESISGIVHQLRHPISSLVVSCESILLQNDMNVIKERARNAAIKGRECANFIEKFLGFVREKKVGQVKTNINRLIMDVLELNNDQFKIDGITVIKQLKLSLPDSYADPDLFQQVILNIIHNARQSILQKGIPGQLTVKTDFDDKITKVMITDTGTGIPEEKLETIFEPFYTTKESEGGTGLGLSIAKDIIEKHNGKIYALSKEREGTIIVIELPIIREV